MDLYRRVALLPLREQLVFGTASSQRMLCFFEELSRRTGSDVVPVVQSALGSSWDALVAGVDPDDSVWRSHMREVGGIEVPVFPGQENRMTGATALESVIRLCLFWLAPSVGVLGRIYFTSVEAFESAFMSTEGFGSIGGEAMPGFVAEAERREADVVRLEADGAVPAVVAELRRRALEERQLFVDGMFL